MNTVDNKLYGWVLQPGRIEYECALQWQRRLVKLRRDGMARDTIIMLEHPPVITVGRDGHIENYQGLSTEPIKIERGGDVTFHGPGQLVVYFIFNLTRRGRDLHKFMSDIQQGVVDTLKEYDLVACKGDEYTGVWVDNKKIASVGIAVKQWISFHGVAINLNTKLAEFEQINPCGLSADVMTSAAEQIGKRVDRQRFSRILLDSYSKIFDTMFTPLSLEELDEDMESQSGGNTV